MTTPMLMFMVIATVVPFATFIYCKRKYDISIKTVLVGALIFFVFTQILEKLLHYFVFTKTNIIEYPYIFGIYGALAAGVFEETGRYFAFTKLLKKYRKWKDGLGYGIGHGGFESVLLGVLIPVQVIALTRIDLSSIPSEGMVSETLINALLSNTQNYSYWLVASGERIMAFTVQIALSILVLYSVKTKKLGYFLLAILLHALLDFPAALYQANVISLAVVEIVAFIFAVAGFYFIVRSQRLFVEM